MAKPFEGRKCGNCAHFLITREDGIGQIWGECRRNPHFGQSEVQM